MAETNNTTSNTTAADENKVGASKPSKKLKSSKVNDDIEKKGLTISGDRPDQININPVQEQAEHTAVTNLNMRAQPVHKGHVKVIRAVEAEAKRVGGSAHIVTSHSEGDEKNPIPTSKKVGYLKKVAAPGTHVSSTSREAPSVIDTAAKLNRHAHHLVVVAGADRAGEYEKLLHRYNGKPDKSGKVHYNFKSITVKKIDRDPDAEGTKGISGTKMREHARNGNISGFKSGLPPELHQHAEEMMGDINKSSKKKVKESVDELFDSRFIDTDDTQSVMEVIKKSDILEKMFGKHREAVPRSGQDRKTVDLVTRNGEDRKKDDRPFRTQSIVKRRIDEVLKMKKSAWEKMLSKNPKYNESEKRAQEAKAGLNKANSDYQAILDREAAEKKRKANEAFERINEVGNTPQGREALKKVANRADHEVMSSMGDAGVLGKRNYDPKNLKKYAKVGMQAAKRLNRDVRTEAKAPKWDEEEFNLVRSGMWRHHTGDSSIHYGGDSKSYTVMHGNDRDPVKYRTLDGAQKAVRAKLKEDKKMYKCPECGAPVEKKGMNCGACHENMKEEVVQEKRGLWDNIWAKRKRIKNGSGEHMRKPGSKGAPTNKDFKDSQ